MSLYQIQKITLILSTLNLSVMMPNPDSCLEICRNGKVTLYTVSPIEKRKENISVSQVPRERVAQLFGDIRRIMLSDTREYIIFANHGYTLKLEYSDTHREELLGSIGEGDDDLITVFHRFMDEYKLEFPFSTYNDYRHKSAGNIVSEIKVLNGELDRLKYTIEAKGYERASLHMPDEYWQLRNIRKRIEFAKQALAEAGGSYTLTGEEAKAIAFDESIPLIESMTLSIGGFFGPPPSKHIITVTEKRILRKASYGLGEPFRDVPGDVMCKEELFEQLRDLHMGEWLNDYDPERFGYIVMDGTQWELEIRYRDGREPVCFSGSNAYPYNFCELEELFGICVEEDEDEEDEE